MTLVNIKLAKKNFLTHILKRYGPQGPRPEVQKGSPVNFDELGHVGYQFYSDFSKENEYPKILNGTLTGWDPLGYPEGPPRTPLVNLMKAWHVGY